MGLLTIIRKMKQREKEMRILMLGLDNAGKTTILKRFNGESIDSVSPTLGFNIKTFEFKGVMLNVWDVGGQKSLRSYWRNYFEATEGLIWVVDSADKRRLDDCRRELHELVNTEKLFGASLLILANKQDLAGALSVEEIKEVLELEKISNRQWNVLSCSAMSGENLLEGIDWLVSDIGARMFMPD
ncbi:ADP-ribosylation factor-like protein 2 isoform X2 [Bacillus rossius redtenbacheri]|uniref:ADP-ribosylation factor-like protein 2 isoform X2 n=1 Tax=Bacillus rossius redtenbacheri TaxID=93214 RepID=UPI002FDD3176